MDHLSLTRLSSEPDSEGSANFGIVPPAQAAQASRNHTDSAVHDLDNSASGGGNTVIHHHYHYCHAHAFHSQDSYADGLQSTVSERVTSPQQQESPALALRAKCDSL